MGRFEYEAAKTRKLQTVSKSFQPFQPFEMENFDLGHPLYFFIGQNSNSFSFAKILHFCRTIMPFLATILMGVYEPYMDRGGRPKQSIYNTSNHV